MAILAGVTQLNKSEVSDVMSNKILKGRKRNSLEAESQLTVSHLKLFLKFSAVTENQSSL